MKFRFHRGGFQESMDTTIEVKNMDELIDHLNLPHKLTFQHCGLDSRNGWDTYYVVANDVVIGMTDGLFVSMSTVKPDSVAGKEITFDALDALGFEKWNECFTYRSFPAPLYGTYRIDKDDEGKWRIYNGYNDETLLRPRNMIDVLYFFNETRKLVTK